MSKNITKKIKMKEVINQRKKVQQIHNKILIKIDNRFWKIYKKDSKPLIKFKTF